MELQDYGKQVLITYYNGKQERFIIDKDIVINTKNIRMIIIHKYNNIEYILKHNKKLNFDDDIFTITNCSILIDHRLPSRITIQSLLELLICLTK